MIKFLAPNIAAAATFALAVLPSAAHAHYIWATVEKGQVRFALLGNVGEAPSAAFEKYVMDLAPQSGGGALTLGTPKDGARYAPLASGQDTIVAESIVGARDRGGPAYLLIYDAKGVAMLAAAQTSVKAPAEVTARHEGNDLVVSVRDEGEPAPQSDVWVQWPGATEAGSVKTDAKGEVRFPWTEKASKGGFVGIRALVTEAKEGDNGGKHYTSIHRWTTLTFPLTATLAAETVGAAEKPFHQVLRAAFGDQHEVVSSSAFNQTLFDGKLTRAQLITHLQQRALVHNQVHHVLAGETASPPVPVALYGAAQRNVLVLLFTDLIDMGSGWPTDADARPLTRAFLEEIRDSEKQGPYFALGVQHVYYGGITNGGRMIGKQIGETLKITPTYYEKSDGYAAYLTEVDKIADPHARAEMIRGGQSAYRYIISSSNEDIFKSAAGSGH